MESVINRIVEIDRNATERINSAYEKKKHIMEDTKNQCRDLKLKIESDAENRISQIEDFNKSEYEMEAAELEKKFNDEINEMNTFYEQNHKIIEREIFAEIVGE